MKDYLESEDARNKAGRKVFERFLKAVLGPTTEVMVAHHITFIDESGEPNEIPSADTLWTDHYLMTRAFGGQAKTIINIVAHRPSEEREQVISSFLDTALIPQTPQTAVA